jgi:nucleoid DNA-binding protein
MVAKERIGGERGRPHSGRTFAGLPPFTLTWSFAGFNVEALQQRARRFSPPQVLEEKGPVTKKEIVKQISDEIGLTQLKTKEIVQKTFDAIVATLLKDGRIELRNFGVFEVKQRKARKARNPRTGDKVDVPPKNVVTFKPGKEMEEMVRNLAHLPILVEDEEAEAESAAAPALAPVGVSVLDDSSNGADPGDGADSKPKTKPRARKTT